MIADSNAAVQDKALDALIAYLKAADADVGRFKHFVSVCRIDSLYTVSNNSFRLHVHICRMCEFHIL